MVPAIVKVGAVLVLGGWGRSPCRGWDSGEIDPPEDDDLGAGRQLGE